MASNILKEKKALGAPKESYVLLKGTKDRCRLSSENPVTLNGRLKKKEKSPWPIFEGSRRKGKVIWGCLDNHKVRNLDNQGCDFCTRN